LWKDHRQQNGLKEEEPSDNLLTSIELVLDNHNQLVEMNRLPGENEVALYHPNPGSCVRLSAFYLSVCLSHGRHHVCNNTLRLRKKSTI